MRIPTWYRRSQLEAITEIAQEAWELGREIPVVKVNQDQNIELIIETCKMMGNYRDGRTKAGKMYKHLMSKPDVKTISIVDTDFGTVEIKLEDK